MLTIECWMRRAIALPMVMILLAGCVTGRFESVSHICPPVATYGREVLKRAAEEAERLPPGSATERLLADYHVLRNELRACRRR